MLKSNASIFVLGAAALALSACSGETPAGAVEDAAKKTVETVKDVATSGDLCTTMGPQTPRDISPGESLAPCVSCDNSRLYGLCLSGQHSRRIAPAKSPADRHRHAGSVLGVNNRPELHTSCLLARASHMVGSPAMPKARRCLA